MSIFITITTLLVWFTKNELFDFSFAYHFRFHRNSAVLPTYHSDSAQDHVFKFNMPQWTAFSVGQQGECIRHPGKDLTHGFERRMPFLKQILITRCHISVSVRELNLQPLGKLGISGLERFAGIYHGLSHKTSKSLPGTVAKAHDGGDKVNLWLKWEQHVNKNDINILYLSMA
jgi:hypothetical protein